MSTIGYGQRQQHIRRRPSRRTFVRGLVIGGTAIGAGVWPLPSWAQVPPHTPPAELSGTEFDLRVGEAPLNLTGATRQAIVVNGSLPAPTLRWRQGDTITLRVTNTLDEETSIHWHGILLPANMDGVPGLSFHGIHPGETFEYRFRVRQSGTYWYHSHSGFQEQRGLYGSIVIEPRSADPVPFDREHVVLLSDWTDERPARVLSNLKKQPSYYNFHQRTLGTFFRDVRAHGVAATLADRREWGRMRMSAADLADVSGATYTYLLNGRTPAANWTGLFTPGQRVRLRFINGSAMTYFDVRIPGVTMTVVAADGQPVQPVTVDEFRIAVAETFDVVVEPSGSSPLTIFAQSMDRTGYARGTLAVSHGQSAAVPTLDARAVLTMADMGHGDMAGMDHSTVAAPPLDPHAGHTMPAPAPAPTDPPAGHDMAHMGGVQGHPPSEAGNPLVDMQAIAPVSGLDDPGIGLRENGRRVLTYADLKSAFSDPDGRAPGRTIELHLTGSMEKFAWSFDGIKFSAAEPIRLKYGERVRLVFVNDTMMTHPIHLHGMWSDLEDEEGGFHLRKHTVNMPPGTRRSVRVTANALGRWAFHCHLLYHMDAGMMREVRVEE